MKLSHLFSVALALAIALPASGLAAGLQLTIDLTGDAEQRVIAYQCDEEDELREVTYINASPNFLAILEIENKPLIMASIPSGSGVQYVAGQYQWVTKGADASLFDILQGPDAAPLLTCLEATDIP